MVNFEIAHLAFITHDFGLDDVKVRDVATNNIAAKRHDRFICLNIDLNGLGTLCGGSGIKQRRLCLHDK